MTSRRILKPSPEHPIDIELAGRRVTVKVDGKLIAQTENALELREAKYPPVLYIPRADVRMESLERSEHTTYCPFKGDANYYGIPALGERGANAIWTYENPYEAVAPIKEHLAFYPDRVEIVS
ncbi:uncharacterized protein (DUF427 family) [Panacagrimonas perspica]|uniref:Uncharacterized protein (DUF427 family) n=1 Tax=Panacagrimonas perspica TaxID=381431 RepID=A0A4S3KAY0_9GAMM|nr:DUF427 domain-containing protein [Panacagrimonas perspica]TDU32618.1 uncharacterized protein (DUF427 family) [Panacagrimonas perspica]THD05507.1 hypothetical protein B1810_01960 [Panacagrimonas perspica]